MVIRPDETNSILCILPCRYGFSTAPECSLACEDDMGRYVPKTYKNRRLLRFILGAILFLVLAAVIIFLVLFFILENYFIDGKLDIPWLN